ncbi:hypothetical protein [Micromonospora peucetia]|uniref:hypothetical protein n=1 Tax=Micromonospora peucetia TaxID=47871 RepID=UPI00159F2AEE|nr:hypothetical protein [Micromonospora peucetia]
MAGPPAGTAAAGAVSAGRRTVPRSAVEGTAPDSVERSMGRTRRIVDQRRGG